MGDGVIYIASQGNEVTALQASDGTSLWRFTAPPGSDYQITSLLKGVLYVSVGADGQSGGVYALQASNGSVLWRYTTDSFVNMFASSNGASTLSRRASCPRCGPVTVINSGARLLILLMTSHLR